MYESMLHGLVMYENIGYWERQRFETVWGIKPEIKTKRRSCDHSQKIKLKQFTVCLFWSWRCFFPSFFLSFLPSCHKCLLILITLGPTLGLIVTTPHFEGVLPSVCWWTWKLFVSQNQTRICYGLLHGQLDQAHDRQMRNILIVSTKILTGHSVNSDSKLLYFIWLGVEVYYVETKEGLTKQTIIES